VWPATRTLGGEEGGHPDGTSDRGCVYLYVVMKMPPGAAYRRMDQNSASSSAANTWPRLERIFFCFFCFVVWGSRSASLRRSLPRFAKGSRG